MNEENQIKFKSKIKDAQSKANEMVRDEFAKCKSLSELQECYRGCADGIQFTVPLIAASYLGLGGALEDLQQVARNWVDESAGNLNAIYDDAAQRFATVH